MDSENIIGVNVANAVSIVVMAAFGALVLIGLRKLATGKKQPAVVGPTINDFVSA